MFSAIPTEPQGGNHTAAFAKAASSKAAHSATMAITKGLALTGYRILTDTAFFDKVMNIHSKIEVTPLEPYLCLLPLLYPGQGIF